MASQYDEFEAVYEGNIKRLKAEFPAEWSITGYKGHAAREGVAWVANLRLNGKAVAHLEDAGRGGSIDIEFHRGPGDLRGRSTEAFKLWDAAVKAALPDERLEPEAIVIEALLQRAGR